jgi:hypothetical protein
MYNVCVCVCVCVCVGAGGARAAWQGRGGRAQARTSTAVLRGHASAARRQAPEVLVTCFTGTKGTQCLKAIPHTCREEKARRDKERDLVHAKEEMDRYAPFLCIIHTHKHIERARREMLV